MTDVVSTLDPSLTAASRSAAETSPNGNGNSRPAQSAVTKTADVARTPGVSSNGGSTPPPATSEPTAPAGQGKPRHQPLHKPSDTRAFAPTLLGTAIFFISLAVAIAITLYSFGNPEEPDQVSFVAWTEWKGIAAPILGALLALAACWLFARLQADNTNPDRVDSQLYGELRTRLENLEAVLPVLCPDGTPRICDDPSPLVCEVSCREAWARRNFINDELQSRGARWVLGSGFVDIYRHLHAAEEALLLVQPVSSVVSNAHYDQLRLTGADAAIPNADSLRQNLQKALSLVAGRDANFLAPAGSDGDSQGDPPQPPTPEERALGRVVIRDIRRAISEFRDDERAKLVRARNQLISTGTITAVSGYTLLALAMLLGATPEQVVSGVVYYVVGAGVGLFSQLRADNECQAEEEDFGFSRARLFYVPVISGLAAVGGVMLVALLSEAANFHKDVPDRSLDAAFSVKDFSLGLVIAAVFGLTPSLLIERLQAKAADYRKALKLTTATAGAPAAGK